MKVAATWCWQISLAAEGVVGVLCHHPVPCRSLLSLLHLSPFPSTPEAVLAARMPCTLMQHCTVQQLGHTFVPVAMALHACLQAGAVSVPCTSFYVAWVLVHELLLHTCLHRARQPGGPSIRTFDVHAGPCHNVRAPWLGCDLAVVTRLPMMMPKQLQQLLSPCLLELLLQVS